MSFNKLGLKRNINDDRVLVLEPMDDKQPLSSLGLVDPKLFTGGNKLHAIKDPQTCFWYLKYDSGMLPPQLKQQFTGFSALMKHTTDYYRKRNIKITEVID